MGDFIGTTTDLLRRTPELLRTFGILLRREDPSAVAG
jgi:hypothetical protein